MTSVFTDRVDGFSTTKAIKHPVKVSTTADITLSGLQTIDGVALATDDRVLVKDQTTQTENGIYLADTSSWNRADDFNGTRDATEGTTVLVQRGATLSDSYWRVSSSGDVVFDTTSITFERALVNSGSTVSFLQSGTGAITRTQQEKSRDVVSVKDFGAAGDDSTDDTAAIQAAIDHIIALDSGTVYFPPGIYIVDTIDLDGQNITIDASAAYLKSSTASAMFTFGGTTNFQFFDIRINRILNSAGGGDIFKCEGLVAHGTIYVTRLTNGEAGSRIFKCHDTDGGSAFFLTLDGHQWTHHSSATVNGIDVLGSTNTFSENRIQFTRAEATGSLPFIKLECDTTGNFFHNNYIMCGWERLDGGAVALHGCANCKIENGNFYDMTTTTKDLILLTASAGGNKCRNTMISNVARNSGTLGGSLYDINVDDAEETIIINCGSHKSTTVVTYNLNSSDTLVINPSFVTFVNNTSAAQIISNTGVSKLAPYAVIVKTIATGVITVDSSYHRVDTEAAGATDDLDTINGGIDGMSLTLQSQNNARDPTIKNGTGNIRLLGAADFTLTRVTDTIELVYSTITGEWCEVSRSDNQV